MLEDATLARFIESFEKFDDMRAPHPVPPEMDGGTDAEYGFQRWKPIALKTDVNALNDVYARIPGPLPELYERLVLNYRWLEVNLDDRLRLLGNPPGRG